jgi:hypothetical protein
MDLLMRILVGIRRVEEVIDEATADAVRKQLRELRKEVHEEYLKRRPGAPKEHLGPTRARVHDVPAPPGTLFERTFTGTYVGRLKEEGSEE